jgi:hypothetical protein
MRTLYEDVDGDAPLGWQGGWRPWAAVTLPLPLQKERWRPEACPVRMDAPGTLRLLLSQGSVRPKQSRLGRTEALDETLDVELAGADEVELRAVRQH